MESEARAGSLADEAAPAWAEGACGNTLYRAVEQFLEVMTERLPSEEVRSRHGRRATGAITGCQNPSAKGGLGCPVFRITRSKTHLLVRVLNEQQGFHLTFCLRRI